MTCFTPINTQGIAGVFSNNFSVQFVSVLVSLILIQPHLKLFLERVLCQSSAAEVPIFKSWLC